MGLIPYVWEAEKKKGNTDEGYKICILAYNGHNGASNNKTFCDILYTLDLWPANESKFVMCLSFLQFIFLYFRFTTSRWKTLHTFQMMMKRKRNLHRGRIKRRNKGRRESVSNYAQLFVVYAKNEAIHMHVVTVL